MIFARLFRRRDAVASSASTLGKLGGAARARKLREPFRAKCREMREQLGMAPDARLA